MNMPLEDKVKNSLFEAIVSSSQDAIVVLNNEQKVDFWNTTAEKLFGYKQQEVLGKDLHDLITVEKEHSSKKKNLREFFSTGHSPVLDKIIELPVKKKDGTEFVIELTVSGVYVDKKWIAVGIMRDVTVREKIEKELAQKSRELEIIFDSSPLWVYFKDAENRFIRVNKAYADFMKMDKKKLEGKSIFDLYPKDEANEYWEQDKEVMKKGKPQLHIESMLELKDRTIWVETDKIPFKDKDGKIIGIIGFTRDITHRKQLEEEFRIHNQDLERMNKLMIERELKMIELKKEIERLQRHY